MLAPARRHPYPTRRTFPRPCSRPPAVPLPPAPCARCPAFLLPPPLLHSLTPCGEYLAATVQLLTARRFSAVGGSLAAGPDGTD